MKKLIAILCVALSCLIAYAQEPELITYPVYDCETAVPWVWQWGPENKGTCKPETGIIHSGKQAARMEWDFTRAKGFFACYMMDRQLIGNVKQVSAWLYATEAEQGTPLVLWLKDKSGEVYIQRTSVDFTGWKEAIFNFDGATPGWQSGDGNGTPDLPMSLFGLAIEHGGPATGCLMLDDVSAKVMATPRESVEAFISPTADRGIYWETQPEIDMRLENYCAKPVSDLRLDYELIDLYYDKIADSGSYQIAELTGNSENKTQKSLMVPYGAFRLEWKLSDHQGVLQTGSCMLSRMTAPAVPPAGTAAATFDRNWSPWGGVFGSIPPKLAKDTGAGWIRFENVPWDAIEKEPGVFDTDNFVKELHRYADVGIEPILLQTLYQRPADTSPDSLEFAQRYGFAMQQMALASKGVCYGFELGNEDNGPTSQLYAEVARHGAAGVRAVRPEALIANSGTAFVDLGWIKMQARRGVFDTLDVVCTHPYTVNESAEAWDIYGRLKQVNDIIDSLGGMKFQWTTEFGWMHTFDDHERARWTPRHFLVGMATGLSRHGLYTWERDYGIFQSVALPPAVSVHAMCKFLEAHRFVGLLKHDNDCWIAVWEKSGVPVLIAWSPSGKYELTVKTTENARVYDLFGNLLPVNPVAGQLEISIDAAPVYITDIAPEVLTEAIQSRVQDEFDRFNRCREAAQIAPESPAGELTEDSDFPEIQFALEEFITSDEVIDNASQAMLAALLRWLEFAPGASLKATVINNASQRKALEDHLSESVANGIDYPQVRYLLTEGARVADLQSLALEDSNLALAQRFEQLQASMYDLAQAFFKKQDGINYALIPYLHTTGSDGLLNETLTLVPGETSHATLRVSSYLKSETAVTVAFNLPEGLSVEPVEISLQIPANGAIEAEINIKCDAGFNLSEPVMGCTLSAPGLPDRKVNFDNIKIEPPIRLELNPISELSLQAPITGSIINSGSQPASGVLRILQPGDNRALARVKFNDAEPGNPFPIGIDWRRLLNAEDAAQPLTAQFLMADGKRFERSLMLDFSCATAAKQITIDGKADDWNLLKPLHVANAEYASASFGGKWRAEDCSADLHFAWDEENLYVLANVTDQTFNQNLSGTSQWMQDSIQLSLAKDATSPRAEIGLALIPTGSEVVSYTASDPVIQGATLQVKLTQGHALYEAAIPWSALAIEAPETGAKYRINILVNDDDAVTGRRFIERYGGIGHDKDIAKHGYITLSGFDLSQPQTDELQAAYQITLTNEDFEEYEPGNPPDGWFNLFHMEPIPETVIKDGAGRNGSRAIVMRNKIGVIPFTYHHITLPMRWMTPGTKCELSYWIRGREVVQTSGIVGVCTDLWGNETFAWSENGELTDDWKQVKMQFSVPDSGLINLIIRNGDAMAEVAIDDIAVGVVAD